MPDGARRVFCVYCGTQVAIDDGVIEVRTTVTFEAEPDSVNSLLAQMNTLRAVATIGDPHVNEIVETGNRALRYSSAEDRSQTEKDVHECYVACAIKLLKLSEKTLSDTEPVFERIRTAMAEGELDVLQRTANDDAPLVSQCNELVDAALHLCAHVTDDSLAEDASLSRALVDCASLVERATEALSKRYYEYRCSASEQLLHARSQSARLLRSRAEAANKAHLYRRIATSPQIQQTLKSYEMRIQELAQLASDMQREVEQLEANLASTNAFALDAKRRQRVQIDAKRRELQDTLAQKRCLEMEKSGYISRLIAPGT